MDEPQAPEVTPGTSAPPPPPAPSGWAVNQPAPARQTYWGDAEQPRTPPPPGTEYAGVGRRFVAWLLDLVPLIVLTVLALVPVGITFIDLVEDLDLGSRPSRTEMQAAMSLGFGSIMPGFLRASALITVGALVYVAGTWLAFGRSPGMALMGIRIVREEDGGRPGAGRVAVRFAGYLLSSSVLLLGYVWAIFDGRKQAWHDKLAGTVVVRDPAAGMVPNEPAGVPISGPPSRRPSIGALTETAWTWYRRWPDDLLSSLAFIMIPTTVLQIPLLAVVFAASQDQTRESVNGMLTLFTTASSPTAMAAYNARVLAATAPLYAAGALTALIGGFCGTIILGACAAAYRNDAALGPAEDVGRTVRRRIRSLGAIGLSAGVLGGLAFLLIGLPAIGAASTEGNASNIALVLIAVVVLLVGIPIGFYLSVIWILAVVAVVREDIGAADAVRRARVLARHRTRWLLGVLVVSGLVYSVIVVPLGTLPTGLLSEAYLDGSRLPVLATVAITGALILLTLPALMLVYVETYRAAVEDAAREPLAS